MEASFDKDKRTAIHEAGHAVAHSRLGILQDHVSIDPENIYDDEGNLLGATLGSAIAEGAEHVNSKEEAGDQVIACYAGYAALGAAGYSEEDAACGADDDFCIASYLLESWQIGEESDWKGKALAMMREQKNIAAVTRVAEELLQERRLVMDQINTLIEVADDEIPEEEYQRCKQAFWKRPQQKQIDRL